MNARATEQRSELRVANRATLILRTQTQAATDKPPHYLITKTLDTSSDGLKIMLDSPLTVGALHELSITPDENRADYAERYNYNLVGEIKWIKPTAEKQFATGIKIHNSRDTDYKHWKRHSLQLLR